MYNRPTKLLDFLKYQGHKGLLEIKDVTLVDMREETHRNEPESTNNEK